MFVSPFPGHPKPPSLRVSTPTQSLFETLGGRHHADQGGEPARYRDKRNGKRSKDTRRAGPHGTTCGHGSDNTHESRTSEIACFERNVRNPCCCLGTHDNRDAHHSVDGRALSLHPTRSFTSLLELGACLSLRIFLHQTRGCSSHCVPSNVCMSLQGR